MGFLGQNDLDFDHEYITITFKLLNQIIFWLNTPENVLFD